MSAILERREAARYADAIVHECLHLDEGDLLVVQALLTHRELAEALTEAAYRAGARNVDVAYADPLVAAARMRFARDDDLGPLPPWARARLRATVEPTTATVTILPLDEPGAYDGIPTERMADDFARLQRSLAWLRRAALRGRRRWTGVAWPTPAWAAQAYPEVEAAEGQRLLARDLLHFSRLGPEDPPGFGGWAEHAARLDERGRALTELRLSRLELRDDGTHLELRLSPGTRWLGGPRETAYGTMITPNFPTEENFTSPEARATMGIFRCSRPLCFRGRTITGIAGEFRGGRLVRLEADDETGRAVLAAALDIDRGAHRLGEVALVDRSSRIGATRRIYFNTLIDENAAAHIAFGQGFAQTRLADERARGARGVNRSSLHLDVMVGTDALEATGITEGGRRIPLIEDGTWRVP